MKQLLVAALALLQAGAASAFLGRVDLPGADEPMTDQAVVRGIRATKAQCDALGGGAVWAHPAGESGECLRYWHAGMDGASNPRALVFFSSDLLVGSTVYKGYEGSTSVSLQKTVDSVAARHGVPYVFVARPGTYGSSGEHKERRRTAESRLVSAALDEIKKRHGIAEYAVAGTSGGGHVVASLLGYRSDIVCAVPASAVASPKQRTRLKGWQIDSTGYGDSYEPAEHLDKAKANPKLRVFVVGDPVDSNVPWAVQTTFAARLQAVGIPADVLQVEGTGAERHNTARSALEVGAMCLKERTNEEIRQRAARGLKG